MDVLTPDTQIVRVATRTYRIKELSVDQSKRITRFIVKNIFTSQEKIKELNERMKGGDGSSTVDVSIMLDMLDNKAMAEFISIILNENDLQFIEDNIMPSAIKYTEIIKVACEQGNLDMLKKNIMGIITAVTPKTPTH